MKNIKVLIVDDHKIFRNGLHQMLLDIPFIDEVLEAGDGKEFINIIENNQIDIALVDIKMPVMNGIIATKKAVELKPSLKVLALSMFEDSAYIKSMFDAGAKGYILKNIEQEELSTAIQSVSENDSFYYSQSLSSALVNDFLNSYSHTQNKSIDNKDYNLTRRGLEVLQLLCKGYTSIEIGELLNLSPRTIHGHRSRLIHKFDVKNTSELISYAIENDVV